MPSKRYQRAKQRAKLEAALKYGPQMSQLQDLATQSKRSYKTTLGQEGAIKEGLVGAADSGYKLTGRDYRQADRTRAMSLHDARVNLKTVGAAADPYRAASLREGQVEKSNLGLEQAGALNEMLSRKTDAEAGYGLNVRQARREYKGDLQDVAQKVSELQSQKGAFTVATLEDIIDTEADRALKARSQRETARHDRAGESTTRAGQRETARHNRRTEDISASKHPKKPSLTPGQANTAYDAIDQARAFYNKYVKNPVGGQSLTPAQLSKGLNQGYLTDGQGHRLSLVKISPVYISAGFQLAHHGFIRHNTASKLHGRGLRPRKHGYKVGTTLGQTLGDAFNPLTG